MTPSPDAPKWSDDESFVRVAREEWPEDYERAVKGGYCAGARQRLVYRWQGWRTAQPTVV